METETKTRTQTVLVTTEKSSADKIQELCKEVFHLGRVLHKKNKKIRNMHEGLAEKSTQVRGLSLTVATLLDEIDSLKKQIRELRNQ